MEDNNPHLQAERLRNLMENMTKLTKQHEEHVRSDDTAFTNVAASQSAIRQTLALQDQTLGQIKWVGAIIAGAVILQLLSTLLHATSK
jgi:hypothetical protein